MKRAGIAAAIVFSLCILAPRAHAATLWTSSGGIASFLYDNSVPDSLLKAIAKDSDAATAQAWKADYAQAWKAHARSAAQSLVEHSNRVQKTNTKNMKDPTYNAAFVKEVKEGVISLTSSEKGNYVLTDTNSDGTKIILFQFRRGL